MLACPAQISAFRPLREKIAVFYDPVRLIVQVGRADMVRGVVGVLVGAVVWMMGFLVLARMLFVWPDYAVAARTWMNAQSFEFTAPMGVFNLLFWALAEIAAGWITVVIARRREAAWVLAAWLLIYMGYQHLYAFWDRIPWWYNIVAVITVVPAVLLGARLASGFVRPGRAVGVAPSASQS